jgi:hypothetical protein
LLFPHHTQTSPGTLRKAFNFDGMSFRGDGYYGIYPYKDGPVYTASHNTACVGKLLPAFAELHFSNVPLPESPALAQAAPMLLELTVATELLKRQDAQRKRRKKDD